MNSKYISPSQYQGHIGNLSPYNQINKNNTHKSSQKRFAFSIALTSFCITTPLCIAYAIKYYRNLKKRYVLELDLETKIICQTFDETNASNRLLNLFYEDKYVSLRSLIEAIHLASSDPQVVCLLVRMGEPAAALELGEIEELRQAITYFNKRSNSSTPKISIAYGSNMLNMKAGSTVYQLASAFSRIFLPPTAVLTLNLPAIETPFINKLLSEKLFIEPRIEQRKEFKSMGDFFKRTSYSDSHRQALHSFLSSIDQKIRSDIFESLCKRRTRLNLDDGEQNSDIVFENGPFMAPQALKLGLIDELLYRDQIYDRIIDIVNEENGGQKSIAKNLKITFLFLTLYLEKKGRPFEKDLKNGRIALVNAWGEIHSGASRNTMEINGRSTIGADTLCRTLRQIGKDRRVRALILRINSPGGSASASDAIGRELSQLRNKHNIRVVVSFGNMSASGGYQIACPGDRILAPVTCLTGSIGVVFGKFLTRKFWSDILGVTQDDVRTDTNSRLFSSLHDFDEKDSKKVKALLDSAYLLFVNHVFEQRKKSPNAGQLTYEEIESVAKGRIWSGIQAKEHRLIDENGGYIDAIRISHELLGLNFESEDQRLQVVSYPRPVSLLRQLFCRSASNEDEIRGSLVHQFVEVLGVYKLTSLSKVIDFFRRLFCRYINFAYGGEIEVKSETIIEFNRSVLETANKTGLMAIESSLF